MMTPREFETRKSSGPTGPTSAAGKEIVSKNALVHGLSGRTHACLPGKEGPYEQFCREMIQALAPVGILEQSVAEDIADDRWRRKRAVAMENALCSRIAPPIPPPPWPTRTSTHPKACEPSLSTPTASSAPSKRTPPISNLCKKSAKPPTRRRRRKPFCSPNSPKPTAKSTIPSPISHPPEPPGSLFIQRPKSSV
jgi:hypothetical protein